MGLTKLPANVTPEMMLSVLGITGLTAYFGLLDLGAPSPVKPYWSPGRPEQQARWRVRSRKSKAAA